MKSKNNIRIFDTKTPQKLPSKKYKGFTLVELIVVITILVILGTISFLQLGGFAGSARDSTRVSNLTNLKTGLDLFQIKSGTYPIPENPVSITASGTIIGYQGFAKDQIGSIAKLSKGGTQDPLDPTIFITYSVNQSQSKMQIMTFLEDSSTITAFVPTTYASATSDYSKRYPKTLGDTLGILLSTATGTLNQPVQESGSGVDLTKITTLSGYTLVFSDNDSTASAITSGIGAYTGTIFTYVYNHRTDLLSNKNLFRNDQGLVGYWDMETLTGGLLQDMMGNGHDGVCYNSGTIVSTGTTVYCGTPGIGPQLASGVNGKVMTFDPDLRNDNVLLGGTGTYYNFTILGKVYLSKVGVGDLNHSSLIGGPECNSGASVELLIGGETTELDLDYQIGLGRCGQYSTDYFWNKSFKAGNWAYIGIVFEGGKRITYFIDGELSTSTSSYLLSKSDIFVKFPMLIPGRRKNYGSIDEVRIYNRALSDSEIQTLYNATK